MTILAIDMGATKTDLALYAIETVAASGGPQRVKLLHEKRHETCVMPQFKKTVETFLASSKAEGVSAAVVAIAGVLTGDPNQPLLAPNIAWPVIPAEIQAALGVKRVHFLNDLHAIAFGVPTQLKENLCTLNAGKSAAGNRAVMAVGTGLGESILFHHDGGYLPSASEGGHTDFGPTDELEVELWRYFNGLYGHVSYERLLSGDGLEEIYRFSSARQPAGTDEKAALQAPAITQAAMQRRDSVAAQAVRLFAKILAAEAANLALKGLATGGVYIGGGIPPRILPFLQEPAFLQAFVAKGRYRNLLADLPVKVLLNPRVALEGAVNYFLSQPK